MIKAVFYFEDDNVTVHSENTKKVTTKFLPGFYSVYKADDGMLIIKSVKFKEVHAPYPNQQHTQVLDTVNKFLDEDNHKKCKEMGFVYKMNFLFYGRQGSGKTSLINYLSHTLMQKHEAIVFRVDSPNNIEACWSLAEEVRKIQSNPIIFVMDEFEQYCGKNIESYTKSLLDGTRSIDNSIIFAATNYMDRIPKTIKERPSRFRVIKEIPAITDRGVIENLIKKQHSMASDAFLTDIQIDNMVTELGECTVDEIKTHIVDKLMDLKIGPPETEKKVGFNKEKAEGLSEKEFRGVIKTFQLKDDGQLIEAEE